MLSNNTTIDHLPDDQSEKGFSFIKYCYYFFVISLPLQWLSFFNLLGLSFKPVHLTVIFLLISFLLFQPYRDSLFQFISHFKYFIIFYVAYLAINTLYFVFTQTQPGNLANLSKLYIYFLFFILFACALTFLKKSGKMPNESLLVVVSVIIFIGIVNYIYFQFGLSFIAEIMDAIRKVSVTKLQFTIYNRIFNYSFTGEVVSKTDDEFLGAPLRNTLMGVFILYFLILQINKDKNHSFFIKSLTIFTTFVIFFLVATSLSRSNLLSLSIILFIGYFSLSSLLDWSYAKLFVVLAILLVIVISSSSIANIFETILLRLEAIEGSERVDLYDIALAQINENPIWGHGFATAIDTGVMVHQAHNLFLNAWLRLGIMGLIITFLYYGYILFKNMQLIIYPEDWHLKVPSKWIICFTVLPLFRALVSSTGDFTMIEWASLAYFFSYVHLNQLAAPTELINKNKVHAS